MQEIYVDILLCINFIVDYFLLRLTALLLSSHVAPKRMVLCALVSSLTSLTIFLPPLPDWLQMAQNLLFSAGIVILTFGMGDFYTLLVRIAIFYGVNLGYAGGILLLCWWSNPAGLLFIGGSLYFPMSPLFLLGAGTAMYGGAKLFHWALGYGKIVSQSCQVRVTWKGKELLLLGYLDTGNHAVDLFTGLPVAFCSAKALKPIFGSDSEEWFRSKRYLSGLESPTGVPLRLIPCCGVAGESLLPVFTPEQFWILQPEQGTEKDWKKVQAVVAITPTPFRQGYEILLSQEMTALGTGSKSVQTRKTQYEGTQENRI